MPELPDIVVYLEALEKRILGQPLERVRLGNPFLIRTVDPPLASVHGKAVTGLRRVGKRIAIGLEDDLWLVIHLMIAGRLHWREALSALPSRNAKSHAKTSPEGKRTAALPHSGAEDSKVAGKQTLAAFDFPNGSLVLTEAGSKRRASLHLIRGDADLAAMDPGGLEVMDANIDSFTHALTSANHTLKRALTDPRLFSGIGNAYSDEILFEARLSPIALTQKLSAEERLRLFDAVQSTLMRWVERLRAEAGEGFPEKVTAFRKDMAVHGRYEQPCVRCGEPIQRIRYADNETDYCVRCQTGGKLLADRALSRLLGKDWPKTLEELESLTAPR